MWKEEVIGDFRRPQLRTTVGRNIETTDRGTDLVIYKGS